MILVTNKMIERIIDNADIEFRGCHSPDRNNPLYGRAAYFMIDHTKVTFPVKSLNPRKSTLRAGLIKELRRRIESIGYRMDVSWSGYMQLCEYDPYSVKRLLEKYVNEQYIDHTYRPKKEVA